MRQSPKYSPFDSNTDSPGLNNFKAHILKKGNKYAKKHYLFRLLGYHAAYGG